MQFIAEPAGRLICVSPSLSSARHDIAVAREHGILAAFNAAGVWALASTGRVEGMSTPPTPGYAVRVNARTLSSKGLEDPPEDPIRPHR